MFLRAVILKVFVVACLRHSIPTDLAIFAIFSSPASLESLGLLLSITETICSVEWMDLLANEAELANVPDEQE